MNGLGDLAGVVVKLKMRIAIMIPASHTAKWEAIHDVGTLSGQAKKECKTLQVLYKYLTKGRREERLGLCWVALMFRRGADWVNATAAVVQYCPILILELTA